MNKLYWLATLIFLIGFFIFFLRLDAVRPLENKVKLSHEINPNLIDIKNHDPHFTLTLNLKVENPTDDTYSVDEYFYRVVINRSYPDSPGYIIKEFSKNLKPHENFEETFLWKKEYLPDNEEFKFRVHFNLYKRNKKDEIPILLSTSTQILYFKNVL